MKIKICGIKNIKRKEELKDLDIDYLGYVFSKSKRKITYEEFEKIYIKEKSSVAVFKDEKIDFVLEGIKRFNFNSVQLHGDEDINYINKVKDFGNIYNKNFKIFKGVNLENLKDYKDKDIDFLIVDNKVPGSGQAINLNKIKESLDKKFLKEKVFLAGGLNLENIEIILKNIDLYGVDVSSGVEKKGEKDLDLIKDFIRRVRKNG
ncbi:phosphoribosylanthranilate isomerase [Clostridium sp. LY3-2]|uniref:phosphoribosylanthranilate isomerase n=1 Tax=Clostridium sp. LY3-2 TaxID=2942482 RepID=UPI0021538B75|nr:phosphoribosylanthranilate isomerase [Clostridium sp. LY3-2]MCR6513331.1 phosphoribosylanthranilate isomerase [Clostridium sp. LY3-2]